MSAPIEPHADIRVLAGTLRQMFVALQEQGFNEDQAERMVTEWWKTMTAVHHGGKQ